MKRIIKINEEAYKVYKEMCEGITIGGKDVNNKDKEGQELLNEIGAEDSGQQNNPSTSGATGQTDNQTFKVPNQSPDPETSKGIFCIPDSQKSTVDAVLKGIGKMKQVPGFENVDCTVYTGKKAEEIINSSKIYTKKQLKENFLKKLKSTSKLYTVNDFINKIK